MSGRFDLLFQQKWLKSINSLSVNVCKSGPLHLGSEKSFPSNFDQETILGHK